MHGQSNTEIDKLTGKGDQSGTKKRAMHIKRFDPSNPQSFALLVKKEEKPVGEKLSEKQERQKLHEEGRL